MATETEISETFAEKMEEESNELRRRQSETSVSELKSPELEKRPLKKLETSEDPAEKESSMESDNLDEKTSNTENRVEAAIDPIAVADNETPKQGEAAAQGFETVSVIQASIVESLQKDEKIHGQLVENSEKQIDSTSVIEEKAATSLQKDEIEDERAKEIPNSESGKQILKSTEALQNENIEVQSVTQTLVRESSNEDGIDGEKHEKSIVVVLEATDETEKSVTKLDESVSQASPETSMQRENKESHNTENLSDLAYEIGGGNESKEIENKTEEPTDINLDEDNDSEKFGKSSGLGEGQQIPEAAPISETIKDEISEEKTSNQNVDTLSVDPASDEETQRKEGRTVYNQLDKTAESESGEQNPGTISVTESMAETSLRKEEIEGGRLEIDRDLDPGEQALEINDSSETIQNFNLETSRTLDSDSGGIEGDGEKLDRSLHLASEVVIPETISSNEKDEMLPLKGETSDDKFVQENGRNPDKVEEQSDLIPDEKMALETNKASENMEAEAFKGEEITKENLRREIIDAKPGLEETSFEDDGIKDKKLEEASDLVTMENNPKSVDAREEIENKKLDIEENPHDDPKENSISTITAVPNIPNRGKYEEACDSVYVEQSVLETNSPIQNIEEDANDKLEPAIMETEAEPENKKLEEEVSNHAPTEESPETTEADETSLKNEEVIGVKLEETSDLVSELTLECERENSVEPDDLPIIGASVEGNLQKEENQGNIPEKMSKPVPEEQIAHAVDVKENEATEIPKVGETLRETQVTEILEEELHQDKEELREKVEEHASDKGDTREKSLSENQMEEKIQYQNFNASSVTLKTGKTLLQKEDTGSKEIYVAPKAVSEEENQSKIVESENTCRESQCEEENLSKNCNELSLTQEPVVEFATKDGVEYENPVKASVTISEDQGVENSAPVETTPAEILVDDKSDERFQEFFTLPSEEQDLETTKAREKMTDENPIEDESQDKNPEISNDIHITEETCLWNEGEWEKHPKVFETVSENLQKESSINELDNKIPESSTENDDKIVDIQKEDENPDKKLDTLILEDDKNSQKEEDERQDKAPGPDPEMSSETENEFPTEETVNDMNLNLSSATQLTREICLQKEEIETEIVEKDSKMLHKEEPCHNEGDEPDIEDAQSEKSELLAAMQPNIDKILNTKSTEEESGNEKLEKTLVSEDKGLKIVAESQPIKIEILEADEICDNKIGDSSRQASVEECLRKNIKEDDRLNEKKSELEAGDQNDRPIGAYDATKNEIPFDKNLKLVDMSGKNETADVKDLETLKNTDELPITNAPIEETIQKVGEEFEKAFNKVSEEPEIAGASIITEKYIIEKEEKPVKNLEESFQEEHEGEEKFKEARAELEPNAQTDEPHGAYDAAKNGVANEEHLATIDLSGKIETTDVKDLDPLHKTIDELSSTHAPIEETIQEVGEDPSTMVSKEPEIAGASYAIEKVEEPVMNLEESFQEEREGQEQLKDTKTELESNSTSDESNGAYNDPKVGTPNEENIRTVDPSGKIEAVGMKELENLNKHIDELSNVHATVEETIQEEKTTDGERCGLNLQETDAVGEKLELDAELVHQEKIKNTNAKEHGEEEMLKKEETSVTVEECEGHEGPSVMVFEKETIQEEDAVINLQTISFEVEKQFTEDEKNRKIEEAVPELDAGYRNQESRDMINSTKNGISYEEVKDADLDSTRQNFEATGGEEKIETMILMTEEELKKNFDDAPVKDASTEKSTQVPETLEETYIFVHEEQFHEPVNEDEKTMEFATDVEDEKLKNTSADSAAVNETISPSDITDDSNLRNEEIPNKNPDVSPIAEDSGEEILQGCGGKIAEASSLETEEQSYGKINENEMTVGEEEVNLPKEVREKEHTKDEAGHETIDTEISTKEESQLAVDVLPIKQPSTDETSQTNYEKLEKASVLVSEEKIQQGEKTTEIFSLECATTERSIPGGELEGPKKIESTSDLVLEELVDEKIDAKAGENPQKILRDSTVTKTSDEDDKIGEAELGSEAQIHKTIVSKDSTEQASEEISIPDDKADIRKSVNELDLKSHGKIGEKYEEENRDVITEEEIGNAAEESIVESNSSHSNKGRLSDLLARSTKEPLQTSGIMMEENNPTVREGELQNQQPTVVEVEEVKAVEDKDDEEYDDENKKEGSGSDAPVMVEASRDVDLKPVHKKSHNILSGVGSKVKHSIAKVKKAIIGKSSHTKE